MHQSPFFFDEQPTIDTGRLRIREIRDDDAEAMFEMDSNPNVHRYLGEKPVSTLDEVREIISAIRQQYVSPGIGRWAVEESATGEFIGWTGFKWISEPIHGHGGYLDVGYRFLESHWGQGFASESAEACMRFAASSPVLKSAPVGGMVVVGNLASERVLQKLGLRHTDTFEYMNEQVKFYELQTGA